MKRCCHLILVTIATFMFLDVADSRTITEHARHTFRKCRLTLGRICPDPMHVKFHLYTRQNKVQSHLVQVSETRDNLAKTFFNPSHPNKLVIHGLSPALCKSALVSIKDSYLAKEEANVWMVDWSRLAAGNACLMFSLRNTVHVARCIAQLIAAINRHAPESSLHVVADRAGVRVAHSLATISPLQLTRITGLNPEGGTTPTGNDPLRLSPYDAEFVDTIHTSPFLPKSEMFGQVDFYVNPNKFHQPGCDKQESGRFACDQQRAILYFAESITTNLSFLAWECTSYTNFALGTCNPHSEPKPMGDSCPLDASGIYITYTADESPYALGPWEGSVYQVKGPRLRTDKLSVYSTTIKRKIEMIDEKTPEIVKEFGIIDILKSKLDDKTEDLKSTAINLGLKGVKALGSQIMKKKQPTMINEDLSQDVASE